MTERAVAGGGEIGLWVRVAVLYLLSFLGSSFEVVLSGLGSDPHELALRLPPLLISLLVAWLLWRAGSRCERWRDVPLVTVLFAAPIAAAASASGVRSPDGDVVISPVVWQALAVPFAFALLSASLGRVSRIKDRILAGGRWSGRAVAAAQGGWRMFGLGLWLALAGVLVLAAVRSSAATAYVRTLADAGKPGLVVGAHHLLLLGNQSAFVLSVAGGGEVRVRAGDATVASLTLEELRVDRSGPVGALVGLEAPAVALGGAFYAFFLLPAIATVLGGRSAGSGWRSARERAERGALAGVVYGALVVAMAFFSTTVVPVPAGDAPGLTVEPAFVPTAISAFAWGLAGGIVGGLSSPYPRG
jgi:hypothetical protein